PHGSARSSAPSRQWSRTGQSRQSAFATSTSTGDSANHSSGSFRRHGSSSSGTRAATSCSPPSVAGSSTTPPPLLWRPVLTFLAPFGCHWMDGSDGSDLTSSVGRARGRDIRHLADVRAPVLAECRLTGIERSCYSWTMTKGAETRTAILDQAVAIASEVGFTGLTLGQLAEQTQMSKSGLFAHFKSKETLQLETLERARERFTDVVIRPTLAAPR